MGPERQKSRKQPLIPYSNCFSLKCSLFKDTVVCEIGYAILISDQ